MTCPSPSGVVVIFHRTAFCRFVNDLTLFSALDFRLVHAFYRHFEISPRIFDSERERQASDPAVADPDFKARPSLRIELELLRDIIPEGAENAAFYFMSFRVHDLKDLIAEQCIHSPPVNQKVAVVCRDIIDIVEDLRPVVGDLRTESCDRVILLSACPDFAVEAKNFGIAQFIDGVVPVNDYILGKPRGTPHTGHQSLLFLDSVFQSGVHRLLLLHRGRHFLPCSCVAFIERKHLHVDLHAFRSFRNIGQYEPGILFREDQVVVTQKSSVYDRFREVEGHSVGSQAVHVNDDGCLGRVDSQHGRSSETNRPLVDTLRGRVRYDHVIRRESSVLFREERDSALLIFLAVCFEKLADHDVTRGNDRI